MKVIVTARVRDEEHNVDRFCSHYSWADKILLADGGSVDRTKEFASKYPNVKIRDFTERIEMENGLWRNPHGKHINFLIKWAESLNPDWIIFDDFDSVPNNNKIRKNVFIDIDKNGYEYIRMARLYLWKNGRYFPELSKNSYDNWGHALWAWKAHKKLRYKERYPLKQEFANYPNGKLFDIEHTFSCLLHYSWVDEERLNKKLEFYRNSGQHPDMKHPLDFAGRLEELPEWAMSSDL